MANANIYRLDSYRSLIPEAWMEKPRAGSGLGACGGAASMSCQMPCRQCGMMRVYIGVLLCDSPKRLIRLELPGF